MAAPIQNHYEVLGVSRRASAAQIKAAFRDLAKQWHPDKWGARGESAQKKAEEKFKEISAAYDVLSDEHKKVVYDERLQRPVAAASHSTGQAQRPPTPYERRQTQAYARDQARARAAAASADKASRRWTSAKYREEEAKRQRLLGEQLMDFMRGQRKKAGTLT